MGGEYTMKVNESRNALYGKLSVGVSFIKKKGQTWDVVQLDKLRRNFEHYLHPQDRDGWV